MSIIELDRVTRRYGDVTVLNDVTLSLQEKLIHGLLGRNGAGKTTLMQIATAQRFATSGTVRLFGEDPYENATVQGRVCFVRESQRYPDSYRVAQVLTAARLVFAEWDDELAQALVSDFGLPPRQYVKKLSRGQLSAVGVIVGLASRAPLTLFDEPYLGLDAVARQLFYDRLLADYAAHPRTVVLSTHLIDEVSDLVDHVVLLDAGRVIVDDAADALRGEAAVVSGATAEVEAYARGFAVLHREQMAGQTRLTLRSTDPSHPVLPVTRPLHGQPISLQQLVVRLTQSRTSGRHDAAAAPTTHTRDGKVLQS